MNRKNRLLGIFLGNICIFCRFFYSTLRNEKYLIISGKTPLATGRHKLYRKSISTANQMLAKRRGRPPKCLDDGLSDSLRSNDYIYPHKEFGSESVLDYTEQVFIFSFFKNLFFLNFLIF